jgi:hypothetical protein
MAEEETSSVTLGQTVNGSNSLFPDLPIQGITDSLLGWPLEYG